MGELVDVECSTWNNGLGFSPSCLRHFEKSTVEAFKRGGVPVLSRISSNPISDRDSDSLFTAGRPSPPDS